MPSIAPYWTDLENFSTGGSIYYQVEGSKLIIEWANIAYYCCSSGRSTSRRSWTPPTTRSSSTTRTCPGGRSCPGFTHGAYESVGIKNDNSFSGGADPLGGRL